MKKRRISGATRLIVLSSVITLALSVLLFVGVPSLEMMRERQDLLLAWRDSNLLGLTLGLILANVVVVALCLPGSFVVTVASGFLLGFVPGTLLAVASGAVGACLVHLWVGAGFGTALQDRIARESADSTSARILAALHRNEFAWLILMRVIPIVPFMVANVAPALLGVRMRRFFVTTLIGIAPGTALTAWIGAGAATALERGGSAEFEPLIGPEIYMAIVVMCLLSAIPLVMRARERRVPSPVPSPVPDWRPAPRLQSSSGSAPATVAEPRSGRLG